MKRTNLEGNDILEGIDIHAGLRIRISAERGAVCSAGTGVDVIRDVEQEIQRCRYRAAQLELWVTTYTIQG